MSKIPANPFILIDGSSYLYRAFHALPPLSNAQGNPTGAIYGVINMIKRLLSDYQPSHVAVVFDAKGKTFRHDMYADYKATRQAMPDDLACQIAPLHDLIQALGLPLVCIPGVEADDVIGTLALQAQQHGMHTLISTGDKDMAQLVNENITLINTMNNSILDRQAVIDKFSVTPEQIIDYLSLMGDSSDNIPGIPKCGPKTAVKWLSQFDTLDGVIANADSIGGKVGESLRDNLAQLTLSRQLVTIKSDVELPQTPEQLQLDTPNIERLRDTYQQLGFKTWLNELGVEQSQQSNATDEPKSRDYQTILHQNQLDDWLTRLRNAKAFAIDTETTSLDYMQADIVGVSFAIEAGQAAYVPLAHDYLGAPQQLDRNAVLAQLKPLLENPAIAKICQHGKYDANVLARYDIELQGLQFDTMLESYVLDSTATRHDMDSLAKKYLAIDTIAFTDVAGKGKKQLTFNQIDLQQAAPYAAEDADITLQLHQHLWPKLQALTSLNDVFTTIEMPLVPILAAMERTGVLIDSQQLQQLSTEFADHMQRIQQQIFTHAGCEFNIDSPKQLQTILFEQLGLPIIKKTPKGQPSTAEPVLQELAHEYELPSLIIEYRGYAKLKSTYTDKLPLLVNPTTGRVHTSYQQAVASTGRLASSDPNLQNIPVRNPSGQKIRQAFIAPAGYQLISADYSQIELRIMAHLSDDPGLLNAFAAGHDIHRATAAEVFGVALDAVSDEQRRSAKAINFGLIYGMSAFGLAKQLGITRQQAQDYINVYFERYPGVKRYMQETREKAHQQGYVETLFGRRLYLPSINDRNKMRQQAAERAAINAPMQGTAADLIKIAMIHVQRELERTAIDAKMIMQVHDELILEVANNDITAASELLQQQMNHAAELRVPLAIGLGVGDNWQAAH